MRSSIFCLWIFCAILVSDLVAAEGEEIVPEESYVKPLPEPWKTIVAVFVFVFVAIQVLAILYLHYIALHRFNFHVFNILIIVFPCTT
ncbi:hypothetical protein DdX_19104 [Ditylenchus destructor]|uniref:Uncharacterized protein n=1 Tax=Ditylenchus destructor TaxID=166010 RepID=A0AAD4MIH8_9BILA|nr:hypothetical protein DdX_19104 [Ditylenchus destructor]